MIVSEAVVSGLDTRANADAELTALMADATDPYATLRSVYLQNQQSQDRRHRPGRRRRPCRISMTIMPHLPRRVCAWPAKPAG